MNGSSSGHGPEGAGRADAIARVVLTGFMGAGKSTIGRELGALLRWEFVDLDDTITARTGLSVPEIFASLGEAQFRELERAYATELLGREHLVLSLGGGAIESDEVLHLLHASPGTLLVYLEAPLAELLRRCGGARGAKARPLLSDLAGIEARYQRRLPRYQRAHLTMDTAGVPPRVSAARIADEVQSHNSQSDGARGFPPE